MTTFRYKAVNATGDVLEGEMEAGSRDALISRLHDLGHTPIRADEIKPNALMSFLNRDLGGTRRVKQKDVTVLTRQLATLLQAGMPLDQALKLLVDLSEGQPVGTMLERILKSVQGGNSLAEAMQVEQTTFPGDYISMIRAGEAGGSLDTVLLRLADYMERANALRSSVKTALIYPAILLVMAGFTVVILLTLVIPQFQPLFEDAGADLPLATQMLVAFGDAVSGYWWAMAGGVVLAYMVAKQLYADPQRRLAWDRLRLGLPLAGDLETKIEVARFSRMLGTLLANGVALLDAMDIVRGTIGNAALGKTLKSAGEGVKEGRGLADALIADLLFPRLAVHLLRVGEETGHLDNMLFKIADIYDGEVKESLDRLLGLLVPLVTIVLGVVIAGIIGSILIAILKVNELAL